MLLGPGGAGRRRRTIKPTTFGRETGRKRRRVPGFVEPALASSIEKVPSGARWIHEIKFDALDDGKWDGNYLRRRNGDDLVYAGKVDHGFDKVSAADLHRRLKPLIRKTQPYAKRVAHKGIWVEPKLLAEVEYRAKSAEGKERHPFLKGLREGL